MSDARSRLLGAVQSVAGVADTDAESARRLWLSYVSQHWAVDVGDLADDLHDSVAALSPLGMCGQSGDGWASRMRDMQRQLRDAAKDRRGLRVVGSDEAEPTRDDLVDMGCPDLPARYTVPDGYRVDRNGVTRFPEDGPPLVVCRSPLVITGAGQDAESGRRYLRLAWKMPGGGWAARTVERGKVMQARSLAELADEGAPVTSVSASAVVMYLDALEAANAAWMPPVIVVRRSGWVDGHTYMLGSHAIGPDPDRYVLEPGSEGEQQWYDAIQRGGTWAGWLTMWDRVSQHPAAAFAVYAAIVPALRGVVPSIPGACIEWSGLTSGGKSIALDLAASVWGTPDLVRRWDATSVGAETGAAAAHDLPLMLDDTKALLSGGSKRRKESGAEVITSTIYLATGRKGRLRGSTTGLRAQRDVRTWLLSTSETPSVDLASDVGVRPRTLTIRGRPLGDDPDEGQAAAALVSAAIAEHHGHLGMRVVAWLADGGAEQAREWYASHLEAAVTGDAIQRRLSALIAAIATATDIGLAVGLPKPAGIVSQAIEAARYSAQSADTHAAALQALWGIAQAQGRILDGTANDRIPPGGWIGELDSDGGGVRIVAATAHDELRRLGYDPSEIVDRWRAAGWLSLTRGGNARTSLTVARARGVSGYRINPTGLAVAQGDEPE